MLYSLFSAYAYISIFAIIALASATSGIMRLIGVGYHYILSTVIGAVIGILFLFLFTMTPVVAFIMSVVGTVASCLLLGMFF